VGGPPPPPQTNTKKTSKSINPKKSKFLSSQYLKLKKNELYDGITFSKHKKEQGDE
jgi:hypothetical protein